MLVLSFKDGARVFLTNTNGQGEPQEHSEIIVQVIRSRNGKVRLGFDAPAGVTILRESLVVKKRRDARESA